MIIDKSRDSWATQLIVSIGWIDVDRSTSKNLKKCSSYKYFYKPVTSIIKNQVFQKKKKIVSQ